MKKILWLAYGPNTIYLELAKELGKNAELKLIFVEKFKAFDIKDKNYEIIIKKHKTNYVYSTKKFFEKRDIAYLIYFPGLEKTISAINPDIIISNLWYMPATWQAAKIAKKLNTPFYLQTEMQLFPGGISGIISKILFKFKKNMFYQAEKILPWTNRSKDFLIKQMPELKNKIEVVPAGIDNKMFYPVKRKKSKTLRLLFVGRMVPYKSLHLLLEAIKQLKEKNITLSVYGEGPLKEEYVKFVKTNKLKNCVFFEKPYKREAFKKICAEHDALVLPSYNEAIGMVVPEALACGLPVIVSDTAGATTYVEHGKNGLIFKTGNLKDLINKIKIIKKDKLKGYLNKKYFLQNTGLKSLITQV
ncbi:glycosyltransferase family 4 protein [Candidatus Woesearchaeota archaeon]|nr:glycosyltransferase family 4 protein [Candidatus Woesearchaeota archaeon]